MAIKLGMWLEEYISGKDYPGQWSGGGYSDDRQDAAPHRDVDDGFFRDSDDTASIARAHAKGLRLTFLSPNPDEIAQPAAYPTGQS